MASSGPLGQQLLLLPREGLHEWQNLSSAPAGTRAACLLPADMFAQGTWEWNRYCLERKGRPAQFSPHLSPLNTGLFQEKDVNRAVAAVSGWGSKGHSFHCQNLEPVLYFYL